MYLGKNKSENIKAQISANRLIAGGPPRLAMIAINQKNAIAEFTLIIPILTSKLRELLNR
ncbi:MAG TPA: hypothetical protein DDE71_03465 [Tenacibaculum sp.]|jgi:hypothetical protein|nr:hypothetical protein [Tenacibaculum sp.]